VARVARVVGQVVQRVRQVSAEAEEVAVLVHKQQAVQVVRAVAQVKPVIQAHHFRVVGVEPPSLLLTMHVAVVVL
jgi:uncharacterized protein YaeQ